MGRALGSLPGRLWLRHVEGVENVAEAVVLLILGVFEATQFSMAPGAKLLSLP